MSPFSFTGNSTMRIWLRWPAPRYRAAAPATILGSAPLRATRSYSCPRAASLAVRGGQHLAWIEDPAWVEERLYAPQQREQVGVLSRQVRLLAEADPVLAGARAAARERVPDQRLVELGGQPELVRVV